MHMFGGLIIRCAYLFMILVNHGPLEGIYFFLCRTLFGGHVFMRR
jgi:hypothetical protein